MKSFAISLVYLGFFGLLGFAIWWTKSPNVLWALFLMPAVKFKK